MKTPLTLLLVGSLVLAGCGGWRDSRINPGNWFGKSRSETVEAVNPDPVNPLLPKKNRGVFAKPEPEDKSTPIARVTVLRVEPTTTGAIIYAEGVAVRQGPYQVELRPVTTPEEEAEGILSLSFRVIYPRRATGIGTEFSRTVHAAYSLGKQDLRAVRSVRVIGQENVQVTRRR